MIDEKFLQSAVKIRRTYLKLSSNMNVYYEYAKKLEKLLTETLQKIESIEADTKSKKLTTNQSVEELMKMLASLDSESKTLEKSTDELNGEIEKLSKEEVELYRSMREKHPNLSEEQIVETVKERLIQENIYYNE